MKTSRSTTKSIRYFLTNYNGIEIHLAVPNQDSKEQKHYLEYNSNGQKKYYGNGGVKRKSTTYFNGLTDKNGVKRAQIESQLAELFKSDIELIVNEIQSVKTVSEISMGSKVKEALESFFVYKTMQHQEGTVDKVSLSGYKHHHKKLLRYFMHLHLLIRLPSVI